MFTNKRRYRITLLLLTGLCIGCGGQIDIETQTASATSAEQTTDQLQCTIHPTRHDALAACNGHERSIVETPGEFGTTVFTCCPTGALPPRSPYDTRPSVPNIVYDL